MFCSNSETCTAIIDGTECGEKSYGRGCVNGVQIHFCEKHIPSNAMLVEEQNLLNLFQKTEKLLLKQIESSLCPKPNIKIAVFEIN